MAALYKAKVFLKKSCKISNHFHVKNIDENISAANYAFVQKWLAKKNQNIFTSHEKIFQCDLTNKKLEKSHGFFALWFEPSNSKCLLPYSDQSINTPKQINFQTVHFMLSIHNMFSKRRFEMILALAIQCILLLYYPTS